MKAGALFAGYLGLEMAIRALWPESELVWVSEIDPGACKILEARAPDVPNLGDVTLIDWNEVEFVEIMSGGFPCQDLSTAGRRLGLRDGTRSGLWYHFLRGIAIQRPKIVVIENVRGILSADAHSDMGCEGCLAPIREEPALRAHGAVLGDLASIGYDASWYGLPASDAGAPHGRFREFIVAYPAGEPPDAPNFGRERDGDQRRGRSGSADGSLLPTPRATDGSNGGPNQRGSSGDLMLPSAVQLLGTPTARDGKGVGAPGSETQQWGLEHSNMEAQLLELFPTPTAVDMGGNKTPEEWDEWTDEMKERHNNGRGHGDSLNVEVQRLLLPTPSAADGDGGHASRGGDRKDEPLLGRIDKLLPTPQAHDAVQGKTQEQVEAMRARGYGVSNLNELAENELHLLPTPEAGLGEHRRDQGQDPDRRRAGGHAVSTADVVCHLPTPTAQRGDHNSDGDWNLNGIQHLHSDPERWGKYGPAINRWERVSGAIAPAPTEVNSKGTARLAPPFSEWMMGVPAGWVTAVKGLSRSAQLKAIGNGVVPAQAVLGIVRAIEIAHMPVESAWTRPDQQSRWMRKLRREMKKR